MSGDLPDGVSFTDNGDGTATLAGTPAAGSAGGHSVTLTASNGIDPDATQMFMLTVEPGAGGGGGVTLKQIGASSASVPAGSPYSGQLEVAGAIGEVSFTATDGDTSAVSVSPSGAISASAALGAGVYAVSGTDSDSVGNAGTWSFELTVGTSSGGDSKSGGGSDSSSGAPGGSGSAVAAVPAPRFSLRIRRTLNLRHGHTLVLHARPNFPATLRAVLRRSGRKVASWRPALKPAENVVRLVLPKAARRAGRATLVLSLFGAGKRTTTRHVPIAIIARRAHRVPTREARRVHRAVPG